MAVSRSQQRFCRTLREETGGPTIPAVAKRLKHELDEAIVLAADCAAAWGLSSP
jgi:hypothetical protein